MSHTAAPVRGGRPSRLSDLSDSVVAATPDSAVC